MTLKISFARAVGAALLASVPFFAGCAPEQKPEPIQHTPTTVVTTPAPKDETTKLKLIATSSSLRETQAAAAIVADVIGITNCIIAAQIFTKQAQTTGYHNYVVADCIPQDGGLPVASFACSVNSSNKVVCNQTFAP